MNKTNNTDDVLNVLNNKTMFGVGINPTTYVRATTDDSEMIKMLKVRKQDGSLTSNVSEFLGNRKETERLFYKDIEATVRAHDSLNPHDINRYERYYVNDHTYLQELDNLLNINEATGKINLISEQTYFQIGKKGSGKTLAQNVWLYNNNSRLENNKILWIRMNVEKLHKLWGKGKHITTEQYFLCQLVYVFCKRFKEFTFIDALGELKYTNSNLIKEIYLRLSDDVVNNIQNTDLTKKGAEDFNSSDILFLHNMSEHKISTITNYLSLLEIEIAIYEGTYIKSGKDRLGFANNRAKSYLIDKVFENTISKQFMAWQYLGKVLKDFILNNDYYILYIVDGIDNINFEDPCETDTYKSLLEELIDFPLNKEKVNSSNELMLIALRDNTFDELTKLYEGYAATRVLHDLKSPKLIIQNHPLAQNILEKRVDYIHLKSVWDKGSYMAKVLDVIKTTTDLVDEEKWWNTNFRCFLHNHLNLAKYITFRYYWRGFKEDDKKTEEKIKKDIMAQIKIYEDINFYLNGEIFACDSKRGKGDNDGAAMCFNLFGYTFANDSKPLYLIYTHLLLLIRALEQAKLKQASSIILSIMECLGYGSEDYKTSINKLTIYGLVEQRYENSDFAYTITPKGELVLNKFFNNIHYLYYSSLDTKLPKPVFEYLKNYISPNNVPIGTKDRFYPPYCIIRGISFLNFLKNENQKIIDNKKIHTQLSIKGIDMNFLILPIYTKQLVGKKTDATSLSYLLEKVKNNKKYDKEFDKWLQTTK